MQTLTNRLKKALTKNLQAMYLLGWLDGGLEITESGRRELVEFLLDKNEEEFGKLAIKEVARRKKAEK